MFSLTRRWSKKKKMSNCQLCGKQWHIREHDDNIRILFENYLIITFNLVTFNKKKRFDYRTAIFSLEKWPYIQKLASFPFRHIISSTAFFNESPDVKLLLLVSCTYQWSYLIIFVTIGYVYRKMMVVTGSRIFYQFVRGMVLWSFCYWHQSEDGFLLQ